MAGHGAVKPNSVDGTADQDVAVVSSALPTGASTSANQTSGDQKTQVVGSNGVSVDVTADGKIPVTGSFQSSTEAEVKVSQATEEADGALRRLVLNKFRELVMAGHTWNSRSNRNEEIDPLDTHYMNESLVDTTNVTAATHYYPGSTGATMDGYADLSLSGKFKTDTNVNSLTVTNGTLTFLCSANNCNFRYYRWVVVASGATNTVILKQRKKAL
jgi:hypothetical protein